MGLFLWLLIIGSLLPGSSFCFSTDLPARQTLIRTFNASEDFFHGVGKKGSHGWVVDYKKDAPGYLLERIKEPLSLDSGLYRATFFLRRGHYPKKGLLNEAYGVFRVEICDITTGEILNRRELQRSDISSPNKYESRWLEFSMKGREGHIIEPRIYWAGLSNAEIQKIEIHRFPDADLGKLEEKAIRIGESVNRSFLENGFVVSRSSAGIPDELGDAATYTGFYAASLAWKYGATQSELSLQDLENALQTLHSTLRGPKDKPFLVRFVDSQNEPFQKSPSKDVYTAFFLAYSAAYPLIKNEALKNQMREDISEITEHLIDSDLAVRQGDNTCFNLNPYFTEEEVKNGIKKLLRDEADKKKFLKNLKRAKRLIPFYELYPGMKKTIKALKAGDEDDLFDLVLPTMNGIAHMAERVAEILREQYRQNLLSGRNNGKDYPGKKLERLIMQSLKKFPEPRDGDYFHRLSDLKILASNSILALHLIKTASFITGEYQFDNFYGKNLYANEALLQCAIDWFGLDEDFVQLTAGNESADKMRKGVLSVLALYNLIQLEQNPFVKEKYVELLLRFWETNKNEDNPLGHALVLAGQKNKFKASPDFILKSLDEYPEERIGFGEKFWKENGREIGEEYGGGADHGLSREPLPVSVRPKDSFLWQRSPRRLSGDELKYYPGTDYLFLYWFSRFNNLIPPPPPHPIAGGKGKEGKGSDLDIRH